MTTVPPGPGLQGQSTPKHGVHVLSTDRLCQRPAEQVQPALPFAPGCFLHLLKGMGELEAEGWAGVWLGFLSTETLALSTVLE